MVAVAFLGSLTARAQVAPELLAGLQWRLIGPFRGGRTAAVTGVAGGGAVFYFGSVDGGVWKTTDAGVTWAPIFDGQPIASIGALAVAPSNPNVLYAGTGESDIRSAFSSGDGVYKSVDGGQTWKNIGLRDTRQISRIVVDPQNPDIVYIGALGHAYGPNSERGVFKSSDGGVTWTRVLDKGPNIGVSDLAIASCQPKHPFCGHVERTSPAMEHLSSAARSGRRTVSQQRQRHNLGATNRQRIARWRLGPGWSCRRARWQACVRTHRGGQEVGPLSLR